MASNLRVMKSDRPSGLAIGRYWTPYDAVGRRWTPLDAVGRRWTTSVHFPPGYFQSGAKFRAKVGAAGAVAHPSSSSPDAYSTYEAILIGNFTAKFIAPIPPMPRSSTPNSSSSFT